MSTRFSKQKIVANKEGFTLLEVLFAMAIATVGLLALAYLQATAALGNSVGGRLTQATFLAQQQIEQVKSASYDPVDMANSPQGTVLLGPAVEPNLDETGAIAAGGIFTRTTTHISNTQLSRLVIVTVTWNQAGWDSQLRARNVTLSTITRGDGN